MSTRFLLGIIIILLVIIGIGGWFYMTGTKPPITVTPSNTKNDVAGIDGTIDLNGFVPPDATISIGARKLGEKQYNIVVSQIPAKDKAEWSWENAQSGMTYELQAYVMQNGSVLDKSAVTQIVSPSDNATLSILADEKPAEPKKAAITGVFNVNGYVPSGSTITIQAKKTGESSYQTVQSNLPATDGSSWTWPDAQEGNTYTLQALLVQDGQTLTQGSTIQTAPPADSETLTINSKATPPAPEVPAAPAKVSLSGTINFNGNIPNGATVSIGVRRAGGSKFDEVSRGLSAGNGMSWSWSGATVGNSYDVQAYLWANGQPFSQSQVLTVAAPAAGEVLTIQAPSIATPGNSINAVCSSQQQGSMRQATVNYNTKASIQNAQQYLVTIGTSSNANNTMNTITTPNNPGAPQNLSTGFILNSGTTYYVQYAYTSSQNSNNWSAFSPSVTLTCQ